MSQGLSKGYRPDIDGLRAIAVVLVIGFHAFPNLIPGGYVGVDIFFVISGYLISKIIINEISNNEFNFLQFYIRRIIRLFPALLIILTVSYLYGQYLLQIDELRQLYIHIAAGSGFIANIVYWLEAGYFDSASETKPLLHLWSLGVEEQFYLLWPVSLYVISKLKIKIQNAILIILLISFVINIFEYPKNGASAFYLIQSRMWELLVGAYVANWEKTSPHASLIPQKLKSLAQLAGLIVIIGSAFYFKGADPYPGWRASIPVLGSLLLVGSNATQKGFVVPILTTPLLVFVGLISYPLYLWHWPILTFARIEWAEPLSTGFKLQLLLLTAISATGTYWFVEKPIKNLSSKKITAIGLLLLLAAVGLLSTYKTLKTVEQPSSLTENMAIFYKNYANEPRDRWLKVFERNFRHECDFFDIEKHYAGFYTKVPRESIAPECYLADNSKPNRVLLWGDSHAQMLSFGLTQTLPQVWQLLQVASSGCSPSVTYQSDSAVDYCAKSNWWALKTMQEVKPQVVIVARSEGHETNEMDQITQKLISLGVGRVVFMGPTPHWTSDLPKIYLRKLWAQNPVRTWIGVSRNTLEKNKELKNSFQLRATNQYVDLIEFFCNTNGCLTRLGDDLNNDLVSWDYGHLTEKASVYLAKELLSNVITK